MQPTPKATDQEGERRMIFQKRTLLFALPVDVVELLREVEQIRRRPGGVPAAATLSPASIRLEWLGSVAAWTAQRWAAQR